MLRRLAQALASAAAASVVETMAEDVTLRVAVHDAPFHGCAAASQILTAVLDGALHDIQVVETIEGTRPRGPDLHHGSRRLSPSCRRVALSSARTGTVGSRT